MHPDTELKTIARLHYLTQDDVPGMTHAKLAEEACSGGIKWIQLRSKDKSLKRWEAIALSVQNVTKKHGATLIINDNVKLALKIKADGVHLGKQDMNPIEARQMLGPDFIIGGTANSEEDMRRLIDAGVDYIGLGPYRFTQTKKNLSPVLNKEEIKRLIQIQDEIPVIMIGGIVIHDLLNISNLGAHGIAVSSAINASKNPAESAVLFAAETLKYFTNE